MESWKLFMFYVILVRSMGIQPIWTINAKDNQLGPRAMLEDDKEIYPVILNTKIWEWQKKDLF